MSSNRISGKQLNQLSQDLPTVLRDKTVLRLEKFLALCDDHTDLIKSTSLLPKLVKAFACSEFIADVAIQNRQLLLELFNNNELNNKKSKQEFRASLSKQLREEKNELEYMRKIRILRKQEAVRIAWRDINGEATPQDTIKELSAFADVCVDDCLRFAEANLKRKVGLPVTQSGQRQSLMVVAMGKLGGNELNFSSDIDLLFVYPESGKFGHGGKADYNQYFRLLGQKLIHLLNANTAEGFVFRVDMRLRPYGESGPLVMSLDAIEEYYQSQGREWERYALIKARVITAEAQFASEFYRLIRPFVYRRYLDYGVFKSLREMKEMISNEVRRNNLQQNIKLGEGGIREVEFIGQAFQLVRGGRITNLQCRSIVEVLSKLAAGKYLAKKAAKALKDAYYLLRKVENILQEMSDQQVHSLPDNQESRARLVYALDRKSWNQFAEELNIHRRIVHSHFVDVFSIEAKTKDVVVVDGRYVLLWQQNIADAEVLEFLQQHGFVDSKEIVRLLTCLRESRLYHSLGTIARRRLDDIIPVVLGAAAETEDPSTCFRRVLGLIEAVAGRSAYLALLIENPQALNQVIELFALSSWIATQLSNAPVLLDELLDARSLYAPLDTTVLKQELDAKLRAVDAEDLEQQMEILRNFKQTTVLHIAAVDIADIIPLREVSNDLTQLAETILRVVVRIAWEHLVARHGLPSGCTHDGEIEGFSVIAYGKLGGFELGYGSDLDLVFLHDCSSRNGQTKGDKVIDNVVFYARLAQRIIHILNAHTPSGILYEVDTRLRPNGTSGLLVSDVHVFLDYQRKEAWTWEHQALVRARHVAGDALICSTFSNIRRKILMVPRDAKKLRNDVVEMRERMRQPPGAKSSKVFDIKQDQGGIVDIEFLVQYLILKSANECGALLEYPDVLRQLEALVCYQYLTVIDAKLLTDGYRVLRSAAHRMTLQDLPAQSDTSQFMHYRQGIGRLWQRFMLDFNT